MCIRDRFGLASPAAWLKRVGASVKCFDLTVQKLEPPVIKNPPKTDRGKVIHILASRLFQDYVKNAGNMTRPNPLRDGIPGCACSLKSKVGCVDMCRHANLSHRIRTASAQQVYDWIVEMVKRRANIVDSSKGKK